MPLQSEIVPNRPLASNELRQIIEADVHEILGKDGMFTGQIAYGRVSYRVTVEVLFDAFTMGKHVSNTNSAARPKDKLVNNPELSAIEPHPIKNPSGDAVVSAHVRERFIASPNVARMEAGLPLTTTVREGQSLVEKKIHYEKSDVPEGSNPTFEDHDVSQEAARCLGLLADKNGVTVEELRAAAKDGLLMPDELEIVEAASAH